MLQFQKLIKFKIPNARFNDILISSPLIILIYIYTYYNLMYAERWTFLRNIKSLIIMNYTKFEKISREKNTLE